MPDISLWPECNSACAFCSNPVKAYRASAARHGFAELAKRLKAYKAGGSEFVKFDEERGSFTLTGGEPTLHPDFLRILAHMRREFPGAPIRLLTNGRMLVYEDFARWTLGIAGAPFEVGVPLFGPDARTHDSISRARGSFTQTRRGLEHLRLLRRKEQRVELRVILTRPQLKRLEPLIDHILEEFSWVDRTAFLFVELEGHAERHQKALAVGMRECGRALDMLRSKLRRLPDPGLYHFPLCVLPSRLWPMVRNTLAAHKVVFLEGCRTRCVYRRQCVGVHRTYLERMGARDIRPITEPLPVELTGDPSRPVRRVRRPRG